MAEEELAEAKEKYLEMPTSTKRDLSAVNSSLATSIGLWMKKHGKAVRPKLTLEQKQQLHECFELMDQDGSGAIDAEELGAAFKLLGIKMKRSELEQLLAEVDHDGSGEVEYLEFLEIMTTTLQRIAEEREAEEHQQGDEQVPFALMATAYRRKRLMEGIIRGDKEVMTQIMQLSERQALAAAVASKAAEAATVERAEQRASGNVDARGMLNSITKRSLARLAAMHVDEQLLGQLTVEERRLLSQAAMSTSTKVAARGQRTSPNQAAPAGSLMAPALESYTGLLPAQPSMWATTTVRQPAVSKWQHFSQSASHSQLLETPKIFELKFSRPTVRVTGSLTSALPQPGATRRATQG